MRNRDKLRTALIALLLASPAAAIPPVPVAYEDEYVTINAGVADAGSAPLHIGDAVTLVVNVTFDPRRVQVETLDGDFFQREFAELSAAKLRDFAEPMVIALADGKVLLAGHWRFQLLDCPKAMVSCPGVRRYELPLMTIEYQLADGGARAPSNRSARFRPWPASLNIVSSVPQLPGEELELVDVIPNGAYPPPKAVGVPISAAATALVAGGFLFASGLFLGRRDAPPLAARNRHYLSRWQRVLVILREAALSDEEWADHLRRCVVWYLADELGVNPYEWLNPDGGMESLQTGVAEWRALFLEILREAGIESARRPDYLRRLTRLAGQSDDAISTGQLA